MVLVEDFIESILEHAAPKYYDPVKAHEYYERTKELQGREKKGKTTEAETKAFGYSKMKIREAQKAESDSAAAKQKAAFEKVRRTAELRHKEIRDKLNVLLEQITQKATNESEAAARKIRLLPPIPKGLPKLEQERLQLARDKEIAKIRGDAAKSREAIGSERKSARDSSRAEVEQVRGEVKATIDNARSNYEALKKSLKAKYETETKQEFEAIKQNV